MLIYLVVCRGAKIRNLAIVETDQSHGIPGGSHRLRFILRPHFGDLLRHYHLRVPLGLRYSVSENLEATMCVTVGDALRADQRPSGRHSPGRIRDIRPSCQTPAYADLFAGHYTRARQVQMLFTLPYLSDGVPLI